MTSRLLSAKLITGVVAFLTTVFIRIVVGIIFYYIVTITARDRIFFSDPMMRVFSNYTVHTGSVTYLYITIYQLFMLLQCNILFTYAQRLSVEMDNTQAEVGIVQLESLLFLFKFFVI